MGCSVLVVDDSDSVRLALPFIVENTSCRVAAAGRDVLHMITSDLRLIITDIHIPVMTGIDLIKSVRALKPPLGSVPIILLATEHRESLRVCGTDASADYSVVKPFPPEEILAVVRDAIG